MKGLRGEAPALAGVTPCGLEGDRRWMVVDAAGRFLSQRELPAMALVQARIAAGGLVLSAAGAEKLAVTVPDARTARGAVTIWRDSVPAVDGGKDASAWLGRVLGVECRLVYLADAAARVVNQEHGAPGDVVSFADGYPVLLASLASLADLNTRLARPVEMLRFRPNLVIEGAPAWAEGHWRRVRIGNAVFRIVKPCDRCVVTTIDPATGLRPDGNEPLRTLMTFRRDARGRPLFGENLVPDGDGMVRLGDKVEVLEMTRPTGELVVGRVGSRASWQQNERLTPRML